MKNMQSSTEQMVAIITAEIQMDQNKQFGAMLEILKTQLKNSAYQLVKLLV